MDHTGIVDAEPPRHFFIPTDLSEWADSGTLWDWIQGEVGALDWNNPELSAFLQAHPQFHPQMWLCLLAYAFSRGVYEAEEVGQLCYRDPILRPQCAAIAPTGRQVTRFRKENRALIGWALVQVFRRALIYRYPSGDARVPAGLKRYLATTARKRLDMARAMVRVSEEA